MVLKNQCLSLIISFLLTGLASSTSISYDTLGSHGSIGRTLLQAKAACSINFEKKNYTIITSKCKGPKYSPKLCCESMLHFSCPFIEKVNDLRTNCATTMWRYINLHGKYPPGLFFNLCNQGKKGLSCKGFGKASMKNSVDNKSGAVV